MNGSKRTSSSASKLTLLGRGSAAAGALVWLACTGPSTVQTVLPKTCAEAQEIAIDKTGDRPENGTYTLYIDGDESKPWEAYCHDMRRSEPSDYLSVDESTNYAQKSDGTNRVTTRYRRLRIDPIRLEIDPNDTTFATSESTDATKLPEEILPAGLAHFERKKAGGTLAAESKFSLGDSSFNFGEKIDEDSFFCIETADTRSDVSEIRFHNDLKSVTLRALNNGLGASTVAGGCTALRPLLQAPSKLAPWPLEYKGPLRDGCQNGRKDGTETDVDCGGSCLLKCEVGKSCLINSDCVANACRSNVCEAADAGVDGGSETGVDSGPDASVDGGSGDATADVGTDSGPDAIADTGVDAGTDSGPDAIADAGVDAGMDSGPDAIADTGVDAAADTGPDAVADTGVDAAADSSIVVVGAKRIFVTAAIYDGNLGGVAGADAKCQADANRPNASTYKALLVDGYYRVACTQGNANCAANQHVDWVLAANTVYVRSNGSTIIGTTNSEGIFPWSGGALSNSIGPDVATAYTGLGSDWTRYPGCGSYCDCTWFTKNTSGDSGSIGQAASLTSNMIVLGTASCSTSHALYCAEQ